ncbi:hypothetical protein Nepgr_031216 [Nepenthes gracilis]|uniref:RING-type domain-containing protein n=1 Tax=Nepenthes gracilis TaxID=150966 RepID=A0AAD3TG45_NEPGR|nr:hypothetical protein Nepgr_031216 [Nepenthes gracilis]
MVSGNVYTKTVCSICFECLKAKEGDLQVISLCGHVFHKLCLQQWFEYCTNGKKHLCLFCKQICLPKNVRWLYLQSIGDPGDPILALFQNVDDENNQKELWRLVTKLETMTTDFKLVVDRHIKVENDRVKELLNCKEPLSKEALQNDTALPNAQPLAPSLVNAYLQHSFSPANELICIRKGKHIRWFKIVIGVATSDSDTNLKCQTVEVFTASSCPRECESAVESCGSEDEETILGRESEIPERNEVTIFQPQVLSVDLGLSPSTPLLNIDSLNVVPKFGVLSVCGRRRDTEVTVAVPPSSRRRRLRNLE